jgi:hypothetical protein
MIYKFLLISDEQGNFVREIEIDAESTFLDFQKAILNSVKYSDEELTTFFICSDAWEKEQEIMFMEMDADSAVDTYLMADTTLEELIEDEGQKLIFVFDMLMERAFFIELKEIVTGKKLKKASCTFSNGLPPEQTINPDKFFDESVKKGGKLEVFDDDFYGADSYDEDELDMESFSDFNWDEK